MAQVIQISVQNGLSNHVVQKTTYNGTSFVGILYQKKAWWGGHISKYQVDTLSSDLACFSMTQLIQT